MTWEEYKTKRGKKTNNSTATTTTAETNTWDAYKKRREEGIKRREEERQRRLQEQNQKKTETKSNSLPKASELSEDQKKQLAELQKSVSMSPTEQTQQRKEANNPGNKLKQYVSNAQISEGHLKNIQEGNIKEVEKDLPWHKKIVKIPEVYKDNKKKAEELLEDGFQLRDAFSMYSEIGKDTGKTILGTTADAGLGIAKGIANVGEGIGDGLTYVGAQVHDWLGNDERANQLRQNASIDVINNAFKKPQEYVDKASVIGDTGDQITEGIGYMASIWAGGYVGGFIGGGTKLASTLGQAGVTFSNSAGSNMADIYEEYGVDGVKSGEAWAKALTGAGIETVTEQLFGMFGNVDNKIVNGLAKRAKSAIGKTLVRLGGDVVGEGLEEVISYAGNWVADRVVDWASKGEGATFAKKFSWEELWEQACIAGLTALASGGGSTSASVIDNKTATNTWKDALNQTAMQEDVNAQKEGLESEIKKLNKNIAKTTDVAQTQEMQNELNWKQKQLNALSLPTANVNPKLQNTSSNQGLLYNIQNNQEAKVELDKILNNKDLPMQGYKYEASDNVKINQLRQQASQYFNNSEEAHKFVGMLEKIIADKDIEIRLDANLKTADGRVANGSYSNGVITINPNSSRTGEFIAIHELTHAIGTKSMMNMVENYRKSNAEFNSAVGSLLQNYNTTELTEETLSDVSAQLFGNQEFINNIANTNPGFFKKIYNEIKYLWHQFRGYKNQNQFVEDLYYKWTKAYNSNKQLNGKTKYSVAGKNAKTANIKNLSEAVKLEEQGKSAQEIYEKTGWYRGNESKWRFEIDDNAFNIPSDIEIENNRLYELHEILDADKLYDAYPDLYNTEVVFMDLGEKGGYYDIKDDVIYLNSNLIKNTDAKSYEMLGLHNQSELFSVLNHEIQHWIQDYEEFSNGSNTEYWENINENKRKEAKQIEQDLTYYQNKIGYKEFHEKQLDKMLNKEITGKEYRRNIEEFINNSEYAKEINKLKEMYDKAYPHRQADELYRHTAGEQEARNVQERIKLSSEEKKRTLPFVKDEFTVYAKDNTKSYSIAGRNAIENIRNNSNLYKQAVNNYNLAKNMAKQGKNNTEIMKKTGWFKDDTGKLKFSFSDKDMNLKNINFKEDKVYTLEQVLDHDTLFMFYPELRHYTVEFKDLNRGKKQGEGRLNGSFSRKYKYIRLDINRANFKMNTEGTLIHEIQHAIQNIEGFTRGTSTKVGKRQYQRNLGEREARDTANRFFNEKYNGIDMSNVLPESATFNRNVLDKMKDAVYNYFNKFSQGVSNEEVGKTNQENSKRNRPLVVDGINDTENSNKSSFSMDNKGRTLTKEQQEYFKDSKVRDENGNLKTMYHGTDADFNEFTYDNYGKTGTAYGKGFYFTDSKEAGQAYGKNLKEVYLDIKKPMEIGKTTMSKAEFKKLVEAVNKETGGTIEADYGSIEDAVMEYDYGGDDIDLTNSLMSISGLKTEKFYEILRNTLGYDGIKANNNSNGKDGNYYLAFNSNQIKNIDNINPTGNPDIRHSQNNESWQQHLDKNFKATGTRTNMKDIGINVAPTAKNNVAPSAGNNVLNTAKYRTTEEVANDKNISDVEAFKEESQKTNIPTLDETNKLVNKLKENSIENSPTIDYIKAKRSKEKIKIKEIKDTLAQKYVNRGHYVDKLAKQTGNTKLTHLYDRIMNTFNESQISIGEYQINSNGDVIGKSIIDIFQPAEDMKLSREFDDYLLNRHNISRYAHEKGIFGKEISATDSLNIVKNYESKYPQFKEWAKEVSKYNDNNLRDLVNNGLVSENTYKLLKKMYGDYVPTFRDITDNISQYEDDSVGGNGLKRAKESGLDILSVKESMAEQTMAIKNAIRVNNLGLELYKTLGKDSTVFNQEGFDAVAMQTLAGNVVDSAGKGKNTFTIFKEGEMIQFKISDELYTAFSKDTIQNWVNDHKIAKAFLTPVEKMTKAQRKLLTTYSVGFAINNPFKDFQDALFNSKYGGATFLKNWTKALYNIGTDGSWYESYKNNGGFANTYFDKNRGLLPAKSKNPVVKFIKKIGSINVVLEQAPRLAEYISTIEHGGSIEEALYNSAEITTNFKRGGDVTKAMNKYGANFLNASVQGLDKVYRNISGQNGWKGYVNLLTKATLYQIAPALLNGLLLGDDEDYEDLPDYIKDNYFLFRMGDGKFFRIPKGRLSSVVGGIARRSLETAQGKDVNWGSVVSTTINQLAPNNPLTDNLISPLVQAKNNKSWFGGDIVSTRLQKMPTAEQYDESTDSLSKWLGDKLNISPKKINYVLDQYSGGIGDVVLPMMTPQAENNILEDKFTTDAIMKNKHVSEYYDKVEELEKAQNGFEATDEDKLKYKYMSNMSWDMSALYKEKREIQNSNLSDKEKKEKVREVQKEINKIAEESLSNVDSLKVNGNTATIKDKQYYKSTKVSDGSMQWNELSDEEKEKNKNISLKTYADYKEKTAKETIKQRKSGNITDDGRLKNKDKMQILISANYSNNEKSEIYENYIKDNDDKKYEIIKSTYTTTDKLNINKYLQYKIAESNGEFKADRKDDGTVEGKSVYGSAKQKRKEYIENMGITYTQGIILYGLECTPSYNDKKQIVNYINTMPNKTNKEKLDMLDRFEWITIYKDGSIKY